MAPGIDIEFDSVPGYSEAAAEIMPHAWKSGAQTQLLKRQLNSLSDGSTIVMIAHREQSLDYCDRMLRLQSGRTVADEPALVG